jgi:hypothetical protein
MLRLMKYRDSKLFLCGILLLATVFLLIDYITGALIHFPILFLIPVALLAWINRLNWSILLSIFLPGIRLAFEFFWHELWPWEASVINMIIRMSVLLIFSYLIDRNSRQMQELSREVNVLSGILPICSYCKKIRVNQNPQSDWVQLERYIKEHSEAEFSHGICPECVRKHFGDLLNEEKK